jgi:hypothetical protein
MKSTCAANGRHARRRQWWLFIKQVNQRELGAKLRKVASDHGAKSQRS